jgi:hypothetical protein
VKKKEQLKKIGGLGVFLSGGMTLTVDQEGVWLHNGATTAVRYRLWLKQQPCPGKPTSRKGLYVETWFEPDNTTFLGPGPVIGNTFIGGRAITWTKITFYTHYSRRRREGGFEVE